MRKSVADVLIIVLLLVMLITSCRGLPDKADIIAQSAPFTEINTLTLYSTSLSLPEGWFFRNAPSSDHEGVLFRFHNGEGTLKGTIEYLDFNTLVEAGELASYYKHTVLEGATETTVQQAEIDGKKAYIITGVFSQIIDNRQAIMTAIIPELDKATIIEVTGPESLMTAGRDEIEKILFSYSYKTPGYSQRLGHGGYRFICPDGCWLWYDDLSAGFLLCRDFEAGTAEVEQECEILLGIWQVEDEAFIESAAEPEEETLENFEATLIINNREVVAEVKSFKGVDSLRLYYIFPFKGILHCVFIALQPDCAETTVIREIHRLDSIKEVFNHYLFFSL